MKKLFKKNNLNFDLEEFIANIDKQYIEYRNTLNLNNSVTFGVEIEFEKAKLRNVVKALNLLDDYNDWYFETEKSISLSNEYFIGGTIYNPCAVEANLGNSKIKGGEIISPVLKDNIKTWNDLKSICIKLKQEGAVAGPLTGSHIHLGTQILGKKEKAWHNLIILWLLYEKVIFRYSYGESTTYRHKIRMYAEPLSAMLNYYKDVIYKKKTKDIIEFLPEIIETKSYALDFKKTKKPKYSENNTIEIRCPNGTLEHIIWQNNINFFAKLFLCAKNNDFNLEVIEKRLYSYDEQSNQLPFYGDIYLEEAIELSNMVFDNDLDKKYFLIQYLKSFETSEERDYKQAKTFIKN